MKINFSHSKSYFSENFHLVLIIILGGLLGYNFLVSPHLQHILAADQYQRVAKGLKNKNNLLTKQTENKREKLIELKEQLNSASECIFNADEAKKFMGSFESKAKQLYCLLDSVRFMPVVEAEKLTNGDCLTIQRAQIDIKGSFGNIARYIASLQKYPKKVWVYSVNIDKENDSNNYLEGSMTVAIHVVDSKEPVENDQ